MATPDLAHQWTDEELAKRERDLEYALLLMVFQYCTKGKDESAWMCHEYMAAGETAFSVLGIDVGDPANEIWERIERMEKEDAEA